MHREHRYPTSQKLREAPTMRQTAVKLANYGPNLLLIWTETETRTRLALMDRAGRLLGEPALVEESLPRDNDLIAFPNGDVGWLTTTDGATQLKLVRVSR